MSDQSHTCSYEGFCFICTRNKLSEATHQLSKYKNMIEAEFHLGDYTEDLKQENVRLKAELHSLKEQISDLKKGF